MTIKESIVIHSSVQKVWQTFTDIAGWSDWNTVMRDVRAKEKNLSEGSDLKCNFCPFLFPMEMLIRIEKVIPCERIVWSVKKSGLSARHDFIFLRDKRGILVVSEETFTGFITKVLGVRVAVKRIQGLTKHFLQDLKKASER
jgi:uncharacterized protein YndB with AHSA1/START domain